MSNCVLCGKQVTHTPKVEPTNVSHFVDNISVSDKVVPYNDAFYEIVSGPRKGGLVHIWNIKK